MTTARRATTTTISMVRTLTPSRPRPHPSPPHTLKMSIVVQVPQDDPEASLGTAEGPRAKTLSFFDLSMTVEQGKDQKPKPLLNNVWGSVEASSLTCIMGPSGAGTLPPPPAPLCRPPQP